MFFSSIGSVYVVFNVVFIVYVDSNAKIYISWKLAIIGDCVRIVKCYLVSIWGLSINYW